MFNQQRKSYIEIGNVYFFTATINNWFNLLAEDSYKQVIIDSLTYLNDSNKMSIFGFVIMPNHIHLILQTHQMNGKETVQGAFLKYTAHAFKKMLALNSPTFLQKFSVIADNKKYEFWQRDSLAFQLTKKETAIQKLNYIHNNPVSKKWHLSETPESYHYSSAEFYKSNIANFSFLSHLMDVF